MMAIYEEVHKSRWGPMKSKRGISNGIDEMHEGIHATYKGAMKSIRGVLKGPMKSIKASM